MLGALESFWSLDFLPLSKQKQVKTLLKLYKEADEEVERFRRATYLRCLPHCGECCRTACVAVSILEMQPVAAYLWQRGQHEKWLKKVDPDNDGATCIFYSPQLLPNGGHCYIYLFRPLLCRLFGFSLRKDKYEKPELMICRRVKASFPYEFQRAQDMVTKRLRAPVPSDYFMKAYSLSSDFIKQTMNINLAFKKAMEIIGFYSEFSRTHQRGRR